MIGSSSEHSGLARRIHAEIAELVNESGVTAVLETTVSREHDDEIVISLRPAGEASAPCQVYVDDDQLVVMSVGRGLRWEFEEPADELAGKVKAIVGSVLAGDVEETTKFDRSGAVVSTKGYVVVNSRRLYSSVRDMAKNPFNARRIVTHYSPYMPGSLELRG